MRVQIPVRANLNLARRGGGKIAWKLSKLYMEERVDLKVILLFPLNNLNQ